MILYPKAHFNNVKEISIKFLKKNNIKALILDVDNTLIDYDRNMPDGTVEWEYLKEMNVGKANYLCKGKNMMPASKEDILQDKIFNSQLEQYINTEDCKVAVLNAFPIFLFDYFK